MVIWRFKLGAVTLAAFVSFFASFGLGGAADLPQRLSSSAGGPLHVSGELVVGAGNSHPCTYHDRAKPITGHINGLSTVKLPDVQGTCFDVSVLLPAGVQYVSHAVTLSTGSTAQICRVVDPILGGTTCLPRTHYNNGNITWGITSNIRGRDCTAEYAQCGAEASYFEFLGPLTECQNVGEEYRTAYAYILIPAGSKLTHYDFTIEVRPCPGGGGLESN